jgi:hypothetical protein
VPSRGGGHQQEGTILPRIQTDMCVENSIKHACMFVYATIKTYLPACLFDKENKHSISFYLGT